MIGLPWLLSFVVGFASLSIEILWVRVISFKFHTLPHAFSFVLAMYLIGIAAGAWVGRVCCARYRQLYLVGAAALVVAGAFDIWTPSFAGAIMPAEFGTSGLVLAGLTIIVSAALKSVLFPIAHHLGSNAAGAVVGRSVSRIYSGNIAGSTLGPLITGFYLLDRFTVEECFLLIGGLTLLLAAGTALLGDKSRLRAAPLVASLVLVLILQPWHVPDLVGTLADKWWDNRRAPVAQIVQNKHGIIYTSRDAKRGDIVFGGNVYDGRINVDMRIDSNGLERVYLLAASHPNPRRVLVIGMSTGAWTRAVTGFPGVERIDVVEINDGYLKLVAQYPEVAPILSDPRVHIHIDDGRRWLRRHPGEMYDLVVQNTTYHWRVNATNLLSREYFAEVKAHMNPGAIATFNTTGSYDVFRTAQEVFPAAFKYFYFVYVSDRDMRVPPDVALARLSACQLDGRPAFQPQQFLAGGIADRIANHGPVPVSEILTADREAEVITDQNLLSEYRHGLRLELAPFDSIWPHNPNQSMYVTAP